MDSQNSPATRILLDFIRKTEVGTAERRGYDVIYGHNQRRLTTPVTQLTVNQVLSRQRHWSKRFGSSATGGYQFMRATLAGLKRQMGLSGNELMTPEFQDQLAMTLLSRRGYHLFLDGHINRAEFGKRLAQEWASLPVLAPTRGAKRQLKRGQSYYAGDGINKALVSPATVENLLDNVALSAATIKIEPMPIPVEVPGLDKPMRKSRTAWAAMGGFATTVLGALSAMPWPATVALILVAAGLAGWIIYDRRAKAAAQRTIMEVM